MPLEDHADFEIPRDRVAPLDVLQEQARSRLPELVPVRHGRMLVSPFTYYRGAAAMMAADLVSTPSTGISVQACGDAHLSNFGLFGSPERRLLFDVNDFDETYPGPWEWDVKRLAASLVVAGRDNGYSRKECRTIVVDTVMRYCVAMSGFAEQGNLEVWYARGDIEEARAVLDAQLDKKRRKNLDKLVTKARTKDSLKALDKLTTVVDGRRQIRPDPPLVVPLGDLLPDLEREQLEQGIRGLLEEYRTSLVSDRRALIEQFEFVDMARKVVGVGSVGTRCWIVLLRGRDDSDPLFLQVKEAQRSVLAAHVAAPPADRRFTNEGERVVAGQRLMQATSDIFLGWERAEGIDGQARDFYVRQLWDWKGSAPVELMVPTGMAAYGQLCAWTLARAHARSGDRIAIAAYLGDGKVFADAVARFGELYADQNERDHAELVESAKEGRIEVEAGV